MIGHKRHDCSALINRMHITSAEAKWRVRTGRTRQARNCAKHGRSAAGRHDGSRGSSSGILEDPLAHMSALEVLLADVAGGDGIAIELPLVEHCAHTLGPFKVLSAASPTR